MKALKEALKFGLRMLILFLPLIVSLATQAGNQELALVLSSLLALIDKYIHENEAISIRGIVPF